MSSAARGLLARGASTIASRTAATRSAAASATSVAARSALWTPRRGLFNTRSHRAQSAVSAATRNSGITSATWETLKRYPYTRVSVLDNGLRVASERGFGETATVGVWVDTGSRYEDAHTNGVTHFLEHLFFKGTTRRAQQTLEVEVENMGGHLNAYTSREQQVFYAKVFRNDVPQAMDILGDILTSSTLTDEALERERGVILKEHEEVNNNLEEVVFDKLHETAFRGTALGRPILGTQDNIKGITRQQILDCLRRQYVPGRMVIAGAGAIDHDELVRLASKAFGKLPAASGPLRGPEPAKFVGSDMIMRFDNMDGTHIALAWPTAGWTDADQIPLMLIQTILGAWDKATTGGHHSSQKMIADIAEHGLANSITTFNTQYSDIGLFGCYAQTAGPVGLNDLMWSITKAMSVLSYHLEEWTLAEAKNQLKMNLLATLDGSTQVAEDIGRQMLTYGRRLHPTEMMQRIDAVDVPAIKAAANRFFWDRDHALAAIGCLHELPDYNWIRRRSYSIIH